MTHKDMRHFRDERERLNDIVMNYAGNVTRRFYSLDNQTYRSGVLSVKQKELLGLVASFVLRCDDCIRYHLDRCHREGITTPELAEALDIGVLVGWTITIPHLRRAYQVWEELVNLCLHPRLKNGGMYGGSATVAGTVECNDIGHWRFLPHFKMGVSSPGLIMNEEARELAEGGKA